MPDPYVNRLLNQDLPCKEKSPVIGRVNCVLHARADQRGLELAPFPSRALIKNEIHELIVTAEATGPGKKADRIAYLAFFEIETGGILWAGDEVHVDGNLVGHLAGYDLTHYPNHFNIIVKTEEPLQTGWELGLHPGTEVRFVFNPG